MQKFKNLSTVYNILFKIKEMPFTEQIIYNNIYFQIKKGTFQGVIPI